MSETERLAEELRRTRAELAQLKAAVAMEAPLRTALEAFLSLPPVGLVLLDRELNILKASQGWSARTGLTEAEVAGRPLYEVLPWTRTMAPAHLRALAGETVSEDAVAVRSGRGAAYHRVELAPWREATGRVGGILVLSYDTTELVRAREQVRRAERRLAIALDVVGSLVWEYAFKEGRLFTTGAVSAIFDDPLALKAFPDDLLAPVHPDDRERVRAAWDEHLATARPFRMEYRVDRRDGSTVWVEAAAETLHDAVGAPDRMVGVMRDVTRAKVEQQALLRAYQAAAPALAQAPAQARVPRVLLAEDHPTNRKVVELVLGAAGAHVTSVVDGAQAVEAAAADRFDLILMDLKMPVMDGLTAIRAIRDREAAEGAARVPILAVTAHAFDAHVEAAVTAGADGRLTKPVSARLLVGALERAMAPEPHETLRRLAS